MIVAFSNDDDSAEAFRVLRTTLLKGDAQFESTVGFHGGNIKTKVTWHSKAEIWSVLDDKQVKNRFWCCFGVQNPKGSKNLDIAVEVNPRKKGTDLRVGGAFARDVHGMVHLCHNGKIGGGRPGVGKSAFSDHYRGNLTEMVHRNETVEVVDLGPICSPNLPRRIGRFVQQIVRIKDAILATTSDADARPTVSSGPNTSSGFVPEFSGVRTPYSPRGVIEAHADHGVVVDVLAKSVEKLGHRVYNDRARDLFTLDKRDSVAVLFEVKTDIERNSIYRAVGQLLLNGGVANHAPRMVLVVPGKPEGETRSALRSIGIDVLTYKWDGHEPVIAMEVLQRLVC